jgi:DNA-binding transcriptional LysR family regulator
MIEELEALIAFSEHGAMSKAATALRLTQSAVSKRIAALEIRYGAPLIERRGRRKVLTAAGQRLVLGAAPILMDLRALMRISSDNLPTEITMGVSESILSSWGPAALSKAGPPGNASLRLHAHRSPVVLDRVRSGEYLIGLCAGLEKAPSDIYSQRIGFEEMILVAKTPPTSGPIDVLTIEPGSLTWRSIRTAAKNLNIQVSRTLESFTAIGQIAGSGLETGLVPIGVANALKIPARLKHKLPGGVLLRPITLIARKTTANQPPIKDFVVRLTDGLASIFSDPAD